MNEKLICCCGASGWTRVIGWFQAIGCGIMTAVSIFLLSLTVSLMREDENSTHYLSKYVLNIVLVIVIVLLIFSAVGFVMAIVLLRGSYNKDTNCLLAWVIYAVVSLIVWVVQSTLLIIYDPYQGGPFSNVVTLSVGLASQGFCLWVVWTHKQEIEASARAEIPPPTFISAKTGPMA